MVLIGQTIANKSGCHLAGSLEMFEEVLFQDNVRVRRVEVVNDFIPRV